MGSNFWARDHFPLGARVVLLGCSRVLGFIMVIAGACMVVSGFDATHFGTISLLLDYGVTIKIWLSGV